MLDQIRADIERASKEEVVMKGTGKAIEKVLQLALWFQGREEYKITIRTGSVGAVDDVVRVGDVGEAAEEVVEETRVRRTSSLEVGVSLR